MKKLFSVVISSTLIAIGLFLLTSTPSEAVGELTSCELTPSSRTYNYSASAGSGIGETLGPQSTIPLTFKTTFSAGLLEENYDMNSFEIGICNENAQGVFLCSADSYGYYQLSSGQITRSGNVFTVQLPASAHMEGEFRAVLRARRIGATEKVDVCPEVFPAFTVVRTNNIPPSCSSLTYTPQPLTTSSTQVSVSFSASDLNDDASYWLVFDENNVTQSIESQSFTKTSTELQADAGDAPTSRSGSTVTATFPIASVTNGATISLIGRRIPANTGNYNACTMELVYNPSTGEIDEIDDGLITDYQLCNQIPVGTQRDKCDSCFPEGIWTAVGCIKTNATDIVTQVVKIGLSLAGGVALLMIMAAGFLFSTSQNDPKRVTEARDLMTSAVVGLLFIIFSVTILQFVGVTILRIPGFGGP